MKRIYLVRHGESEGNLLRYHSTPTTPLTELGVLQADFIAERAFKLPIQKIISSTFTRAQDTAAAISKRVGLPIELSDLFVETRGPSRFAGRVFDEPESVEAYALLSTRYGEPGLRFEDAEVFEDHTKRAQAALQFLAEHDEEHILVVTHGLFKRILMAHVLHGPTPSSQEVRHLLDRLGDKNTGLTILEYGAVDYLGQPLDYPWRLIVWNDHAHLAD